MKMMPQQYCLRWKHHHSNVQNMFAQLLEKERFCDVTLYCSPSFATQVPNNDTVEPQNIRGVSLRAHRVVLAACSELLGALLGAHDALGEPVLVIDGAEPKHLRALLSYMYTGEMSVHHSQLASLLKTAEELRIKGLTDIRWNNKDEPPDGQSGGIITTASKASPPPAPPAPSPRPNPPSPAAPATATAPAPVTAPATAPAACPELRSYTRKEHHRAGQPANGGPPPLIKLESMMETKEKNSPAKRDLSDTDTQSPKRARIDDDDQSYKTERDQEWQHGNLDISAERVLGWAGPGGPTRSEVGSWSQSGSDDEWADAPQDIGSFLHTRLRVPGDTSNEEDSCESGAGPAMTSSSGVSPADFKVDLMNAPLLGKPLGAKNSGPVDPRFGDVVKLNDYLQHGRRPQFWEENYVRRVMEAVRLKELEMKQAAEILGVSYGTLYGRYRDVYGCINRPYRTARDFWQAKGPSEVLDRLQRGDISLEAAAQALGVTPPNLAAYLADSVRPDKEFEPIPIEIDPSLKMKPSQSKQRSKPQPQPQPQAADKSVRKIMVESVDDEEIPASVITTSAPPASGKWPSLRVAQLDTLREPPGGTGGAGGMGGAGGIGGATSPGQLMRTRPDLTIVAARRDKRDDE